MSKMQFQCRWTLNIILAISVQALTQVIEAAVPSDEPLWLSNPYWRAGIMGDYERPGFDAAGFSDKFYWNNLSPRHNFAEHEMLWGEWAVEWANEAMRWVVEEAEGKRMNEMLLKAAEKFIGVVRGNAKALIKGGVDEKLLERFSRVMRG